MDKCMLVFAEMLERSILQELKIGPSHSGKDNLVGLKRRVFEVQQQLPV